MGGSIAEGCAETMLLMLYASWSSFGIDDGYSALGLTLAFAKGRMNNSEFKDLFKSIAQDE